MPERPLLLFPTPEVTSKSNLGGGGGRPHLPTHFRQGERLNVMVVLVLSRWFGHLEGVL